MKAQIRHVKSGDKEYDCLAFICPGCEVMVGGSGLHMLPVNTTVTNPAWNWDGNLEKPTVTPSILTGKGTNKVCHSYLTAGVFKFLGDCNHRYVGKEVVMPDLPRWFLKESGG